MPTSKMVGLNALSEAPFPLSIAVDDLRDICHRDRRGEDTLR
ncbi:hypothetical protein Q31b_51340 [Novipirellula aureliae]|uniref:Uncharacterized protein n=1 Tax=Novipirellula aureliae TaxID=2527966 RepID=A0A5C6DLB2_9BACT|nr:hypothetical protein Q31b_51340 [Novipirellula aureliae]